MNVQWETTTVSGQRGNWCSDQTRKGLENHRARLVESYKVDGKVRKLNVCSFGHFQTTNGLFTEAAADAYWEHAMNVLGRIDDLTDEDRQKTADQLEAHIARYVDM